MPSAKAHVTRSDSSSRSSVRSGRMNTSCSPAPTTNAPGAMITMATKGSMWKSEKSE